MCVESCSPLVYVLLVGAQTVDAEGRSGDQTFEALLWVTGVWRDEQMQG